MVGGPLHRHRLAHLLRSADAGNDVLPPTVTVLLTHPVRAEKDRRLSLDRQPDAWTAARARRALAAIDQMQKFAKVGELRTQRPW